MKNRTGMPSVDEWIEAFCQILAEARDLLRGSHEKAHCPSSGDAESGKDTTVGKDQLLLPGIAEPHRWEVGRKGSAQLNQEGAEGSEAHPSLRPLWLNNLQALLRLVGIEVKK